MTVRQPRKSAGGDAAGEPAEGKTMSASEAAEDIPQQFIQAYLSYARSLESAWAPRGDQVAEAFGKLAQAYQAAEMAAAPENRQRAIDAYQNYQRTAAGLSEPLEEVQQRANEAFRAYVAALKDAFADLDQNAIDVPAMTTIVQTLVQGASASNAALSALSQQWSVKGRAPNSRSDS